MKIAMATGLLVIVGTAAAPARACINTFESELYGQFQRGDKAAIEMTIATLDAKYAAHKTMEYGNDRAVARIMVGRYDEAIKLLRETEKLNPGNARLAANLGTALELKGDDAEALKWIREGVRRDAREHRGTEWLHVRILEAKLQRAKDPRWFEKHNILGLDFGAGARPALPKLPADAMGARVTVEGILDAIAYQSYEREKFVRPPDPIMADLKETGANLRYAARVAGIKLRTWGDPKDGYEEAQRYGPSDRQRVLFRLSQFEKDYPGSAWNEPDGPRSN